MTTSALRRRGCSQCVRPAATCICHWIAPTEHDVEVVVLQHPMEERNAKGSARLLHLSLPASRLVIGETFAETQLRSLLFDPFTVNSESCGRVRNAVLLYPVSDEDVPPEASSPPTLTSGDLVDPNRVRLIVLDGTWRKSRKMLHLNPLLRQLPRLSLQDTGPSRYVIRKAQHAHQLSTLEATCRALIQLERNRDRYQPLLNAFDGFVAQQRSQRDSSVAASS